MVGNHHFKVRRKRTSYQYLQAPSKGDSWNGDQNCQHNREDSISLFDGDVLVWECPTYQTVANMPGSRHQDTVAPGSFAIQWDVDPRQHRGHVHGIINASDTEGQCIDNRSVEPVAGKDGSPMDLTRWLWHDDEKLNTEPEGRCRAAWSAGCFITGKPESDELYAIGCARGFKPGDEIPVELIEVDE